MGEGEYTVCKKTLLTVADRGVSGHRGGKVYVCARDGMHVQADRQVRYGKSGQGRVA